MEKNHALLDKGYLSSRAGVSETTRTILAGEEFTEIITFPQDTTLIEQGSRPEALFFTLTGIFHAISHTNPNALHRLLGRIEPGQFIGEVCLVDTDGKASATVKALRESVALKIKPEGFLGLRDKEPAAAMELLLAVARQLAKRLRDANERTL